MNQNESEGTLMSHTNLSSHRRLSENADVVDKEDERHDDSMIPSSAPILFSNTRVLVNSSPPSDIPVDDISKYPRADV
jgi:hypothetical protein